MAKEKFTVDLLDVSRLSYSDRLTAVSIQGLANREGPRVFLDYGIYDDQDSRTTNEVFLSDEIWHSKYREAIGNIALNNLKYYRTRYDIKVVRHGSLEGILRKYATIIKGAVIWDPERIDTVNIALMMSGVESLLVLHPERIRWAARVAGIEPVEDLRGRWKSRIEVYAWAFKNLFSRCDEGKVACIEPGWERPEFADYAVRNRLFIYSLSSHGDGVLFTIGQKLLLLLIAGPFALRNGIFGLRLDGVIKRLGILLMGAASLEVRLTTRIQRSVRAKPFPTIFGWHTKRDDELSFMALLSANDMRLVPSHLASNFSFHAALPSKATFRQKHSSPEKVQLERDKVYLTFTLSDGDQLMMMDSSELGNWNRKERGKVPFNWEIQPLLAGIAPALLEKYYSTLTPSDYLVAGPSGAGYVIPPLLSKLREYLRESALVCGRAGVRVATSYIGDSPLRVVREHGKAPGDFIGFTAGYVHFGRTPIYLSGGRAFIANKIPHLDHIADDSAQTLDAVRSLVEAPGIGPVFIGVHLFAYRTTIEDVYKFVKTLDLEKIRVVKADEFLLAAARYLKEKEKSR